MIREEEHPSATSRPGVLAVKHEAYLCGMPTTPELYEEYKQRMRRIADVRNASALLQWDQETYLPANDASFRGQQISTLNEMSHNLLADEKLGDILQSLAASSELNEDEKKNVTLTLEDYLKNKKYTSAFVR